MSRLRDIAVLTGRNLVHIAREPLQLSDVTVQPVLFTALFVYVFGAGVVLPNGGSYTDYAIAGLLALNLTTSSMGTAVGLSTDLSTGVIERFRTLPMWRPAVLVGRSLADLMTAVLCTVIVALTGLAIGWRPDDGLLPALAGLWRSWSRSRRSRRRSTAAARPSSPLERPVGGVRPPRAADRDERQAVRARDRTARRAGVEADERALADGHLLAVDAPVAAPGDDDRDLLLAGSGLVVLPALPAGA